ncbi:guanine nucleotide exchange C9orf72-like isoform X2 [Patiria miniata]|uniref:Uncharacterized protein n=1 Tax=Patiria miniata TaxID=46514 RepID=A0A914AYM1_PATMI|nr:guanine nucleotide exchange C9orf72-like isoform X2 [Patiria miniata]
MASFSDDEISPISQKMVFVVDTDRHGPQDYRDSHTLPDTADCPVYALVMGCWNNILGPHAKYIWLTEGKPNFTPDHVSYLSTHTLTSCEQPQSTIDTKVLILPDRGIVVTVFLFSGHDGDEKTIFALSLVIPYEEYRWYLPLHELCVARLTTMIRRLRVLQEKNKDELTDTVFAPGHIKQLDNQFTKVAIASHLQTCGCSIVIGNTPADVNVMISTLALFLSPSERRCCLYLDNVPRIYQKDVLIQGFIKDSINLDDYLRVIMTSQYPTTLIDMTTLEVRQTLHYNEHAYRRHVLTSQELQSLWLGSDEPLRYSPVVHFSKKPEAEAIVQKFWKEIYRLKEKCSVRETYVEEFLRLLDRQAVSLIKYVEEETNRGTKPSRLVLKRLKTDLHLIPEGNFRLVLAVAEKLKPGIYTMVCGNPALPRDSYNDLVT